MIVNLTRRDGDEIVLERFEGEMFFEGGDAQFGVLATFELGGEQVTGRVIRVSPEGLRGSPDIEPVVDIELVDTAALDAESQTTLAHLPPDNENIPRPKI